MSAVTALAVVLVRTRKPGDTPPAVDWPVQYQADDSASGAPTNALGRRRGRDRRRRPPHTHGDADAGDDEHDERGHAPPALAADVGRHQNVTVSTRVALSVTMGSADVTVDGARGLRRRPIEREGQQHPGGQLQEDHQRNEGELREREGGPALGADRVLRRPAEGRLPRHRVPVHASG